MTLMRENLFWILIIIFFVVWLFNFIRDDYHAWRFPEMLKQRYLLGAEKWPKWHPFRGYYLQFYSSDNFVYLTRFVSIFLPTTGIIVVLALLANGFEVF